MATTVMTDSNELARVLAEWFGSAERIALLAVGSELRSDDGVGMMVGAQLEEDCPSRLRVFLGSSAPENCTGPIREYAPQYLVVVDAAEAGLAPGSVFVVDSEDISGTTLSTHMLPLVVVLRYVVESCPGCQMMVVGVEPRNTEFGLEHSPEMDVAAAAIVAAFRSAIS